ncbi:unnamed protein product [Ectocarpus sp. 4 AP-2014]
MIRKIKPCASMWPFRQKCETPPLQQRHPLDLLTLTLCSRRMPPKHAIRSVARACQRAHDLVLLRPCSTESCLSNVDVTLARHLVHMATAKVKNQVMERLAPEQQFSPGANSQKSGTKFRIHEKHVAFAFVLLGTCGTT